MYQNYVTKVNVMPIQECDERPTKTIQDVLHTPLDTGRQSENDLNLITVLCDILSNAASNTGAQVGNILVLDEGGWPSHWFV